MITGNLYKSIVYLWVSCHLFQLHVYKNILKILRFIPILISLYVGLLLIRRGAVEKSKMTFLKGKVISKKLTYYYSGQYRRTRHDILLFEIESCYHKWKRNNGQHKPRVPPFQLVFLVAAPKSETKTPSYRYFSYVLILDSDKKADLERVIRFRFVRSYSAGRELQRSILKLKFYNLENLYQRTIIHWLQSHQILFLVKIIGRK